MAEKRNEALKSAVERLRVMVRESLGAKDQLRFLGFIDTLDQQISKGEFQMDVLQSTITRARAATRKVLADKPIDMVRLLNAFDTLDEELMRELAQGG